MEIRENTIKLWIWPLVRSRLRGTTWHYLLAPAPALRGPTWITVVATENFEVVLTKVASPAATFIKLGHKLGPLSGISIMEDGVDRVPLMVNAARPGFWDLDPTLEQIPP